MIFKSFISFIGKRELAALAVLAAAFAALLTFHPTVWGFVGVSVLFIGFVTWTASAFFVTQKNFSWRSINALTWPIGVAIVQALVCWCVVWLAVGLARHLWSR